MSELTESAVRLPGQPRTKPGLWERARAQVSRPVVLVVVVPTVIAAVYWGAIATPRYVSEAHFIVRKTDEARPNGLGLMLQGTGLSMGTTDAFAVQEYMVSRPAAAALDKRYDLEKVFSRPGVDYLSRYPRVLTRPSNEDQYRALKRFVTVGYNATSGITTLRVQAFTPQDAQNISRSLLDSGETLINQLNERAAADAVADAQRAVEEGMERRALIQKQLAAFRNEERFIDPQLAASEASQLIANLLSNVAQLRAELAQLRQTAPASPQIPALTGRIAAYEAQIAEERTRLAGRADSLAPKISTYEGLMLQRELADRALTEASATLLSAQQEARRQKLYLDRIVEPNLPDRPTEPQRLRAILIVFLSSLMVFLLGRLMWAGLREHRQE